MSRLSRHLAAWLTTLLIASGCHPERAGDLAAIASPNPAKRAQALMELGGIGNSEDLGAIMTSVSDPDPLVRTAVSNALGHYDDRRAADALGELTRDTTQAVQLQAVASLALLKVPRAHAYLLLAYRREGSEVRAKVAELLKASGGSPAEAVRFEAKELYESYKNELTGSSSARVAAVEQLGLSGRPDAVELLAKYLGAEPRELAVAAARGLGASGVPEARPPLEALLSDQGEVPVDPDLQVAGARALAELGDPAAAPALLRAVKRGGTTGATALESLARLAVKDAKVGDLLCQSARIADPDLAAVAGQIIHLQALHCELPPFLEAVRHGGAQALGALSGLVEMEPSAKDLSSAIGKDLAALERTLTEMLRSGRPEARPLAARAVGVFRMTSAMPELEKARAQTAQELAKAREHWVVEELPRSIYGKAPPPETKVDTLLRRVQARGKELLDGHPSSLEPSLFSPDPPAALALWVQATLAEVRQASPQAVALTAELRKDPQVRARRAAAEAVLDLPVAEAWSALKPLLSDADPSVQAMAIETAGKLSPAVEGPDAWLVGALKSSGVQPDVPINSLIDAVALRRSSSAVPLLSALLDDPDARPAAVRALAGLPGPEARSSLLSELRKKPATGLTDLLASVEHAWDPSAAEVCRELLFHVQPQVRAAAARALLASGEPAAKNDVRVLAGDYDHEVREAVGEK